ncbi:MAG: squalene/phytoene synthase family protein [Pseudomonadota bacterium]
MSDSSSYSKLKPPVAGDRSHAPTLNAILKDVSRSFYLTIRALPAGMRAVVGVAYLLARAADTIADTTLIPADQRLRLLREFQWLGAVPQPWPASSDTVQSLRGERALLARIDEVLALLRGLPEPDQADVRAVLATLIEGMVWDLEYFGAGQDVVKALRAPEELERYTYLVAGCVGEFWTRVSMRHAPALRRWDAQQYTALGIHYGKALQLTNVLRDIRADLALKRCYLPQTQLAARGLTPGMLLDASSAAAARPLLAHWIGVALRYYRDAEAYALAIPRRCVRLRLAALWPMLIGLKTLARLAAHPHYLGAAQPVKIRRAEVYGIMLKSFVTVFSNHLLRRWLRRLHENIRPRLV